MALKKPTKIAIWVVVIVIIGMLGVIIWGEITYYNTEVNHDYTNFKDVELELETFKIKIPYKWEFEERDGVLFLISGEQQGQSEIIQFVEGTFDYSTQTYSHSVFGSMKLIEKHETKSSTFGASYLFGRFQLENGETQELYILEINDVYLCSNNCTDKGIIIKIFYSMVRK
jgi:hypothetical protein